MDPVVVFVFAAAGLCSSAVPLTSESMLGVLEDIGQHSNETRAESLSSAGGGAVAGSAAGSWGRSRTQHGR